LQIFLIKRIAEKIINWYKFSVVDGGQCASGSGFDGAAPVKQLEHAMTKLLPDGQPPTANTDFSTDALLKQRPPSIHWIGNNARKP